MAAEGAVLIGVDEVLGVVEQPTSDQKPPPFLFHSGKAAGVHTFTLGRCGIGSVTIDWTSIPFTLSTSGRWMLIACASVRKIGRS